MIERLAKFWGALTSRPLSLRLERLVVGAWLVSLVLGVLVPVYSDEVGWRLQERAGLDGIDKLYSEQCGTGTLARPVWFMLPVRWYSAFFNTAFPAPFWTRASGVAYALVWAALALGLIRAIAPDQTRRRAITLVLVALMGLGTLPLQMVWSRPEQPIVLALTAGLLLAWQGWAGQGWRAVELSRVTAGVRVLALLVLAGVALSYHFKALVFVPLFVTCLALCDRHKATRVIRGAGIIALLALSGQAAVYWLGRLACPGDAVLAAQHADQSLYFDPDAGVLSNVWRVVTNLNLHVYVMRAAPNVTPMSNWLPAHLVSKPEQIVWSVVMIALWLAGMVWAIGAAWAGARGNWRERVRGIDPRLGFAIMLLGTACVWCVVQKVRNVYEAAFVLPVLALAYACALALPWARAAGVNALGRVLGVAMLVSQILVAGIYGPALIVAARHGGAVAGQSFSVSIAPFQATREAIEAAARQCGLRPQAKPPRLLIDDQTYYVFMQSPLPDHQLAVLDPQWNGAVKDDPLAYLRANHASGMVVQCRNLSPALRLRAHQSGDYCCMAPADWQP